MTSADRARSWRALAVVCCTLATGLLAHPNALRGEPDPHAGGRAVALTREDCTRLQATAPAEAVDYVPGVDVGGHPVPPADLPRGSFNPALSAAEIEVELGGFGRGWRLGGPRPNVIVGRIGFDRDGAILLNGEWLAAADRERLAAACREEGWGASPRER